MSLTCCQLIQVRSRRRKPSEAENEVQLGNLVIALDLFGVGDKLLIDAQKCRLVKSGEQGRPFLKVYIDASVGKKTRWNSESSLGWVGREWWAALHMQESLGIEFATRLPTLLQLTLQGRYRAGKRTSQQI